MVDKNILDIAQNTAASVQGAANTAQRYAGKGVDAARDYANSGYKAARDYASSARDYANKGYDAASEYTNTGMEVVARASDNLTEFIRNEPWIAVAAAFAVGYVAARIMHRVSI